MKIIPTILSLITLITVVFGYFFWMENRYALAQEVKQMNQRLEYKIKSDQSQSIQQRIWTIEDRCTTKTCDITTKEELRKLKVDLEDSKGQLKVMEKK